MKANRLLFFFLCLLYGTPVSVLPQWVLMTQEAEEIACKTLDFIYHQDFDSAQHYAINLIARYPNHPVGYFLDALTDWWRIYLHQRVTRYDDDFLEKIAKVEHVTTQRLDKNPYDIVGLFFKGAALGYRGRYFVIRESWLKAIGDGKTALDILMKLWQIAPGNPDILLGIGIYHYFAGVFPEKYPLLKPLMAFLPPGDRFGGLKELEFAAEHARYVKVEAKMLLIQIYWQFENQPEKTKAYAEELLQKYPENMFAKKYLARAYTRLRDYSKMEQEWREIIQWCINGHYGCDSYLVRESCYYIGYALLLKGDYDKAILYLSKSLEFSRKIDEKQPSGFLIETLLKLGDAYQRKGDRERAKRFFEEVLRYRDYRNSRLRAQRRLKSLEQM